MTINMALKRARKAQRRKLQIAEKRKTEALETRLGARVLRAAKRPIQHCLLHQSLFEIGMGTLVLARGATPHHLEVGVFLLDAFCLGIKDVMFTSVDDDTFDMYVAASESAAPMAPVEPSYARRLLRDLADWSRSIGFAPHPDFAAVEPLFGDVDANASNATFQFGREGKPVYIPGPDESLSVIERRVEHLRRTVGEDGFDLDSAA